jgi:hypothetical protein
VTLETLAGGGGDIEGIGEVVGGSGGNDDGDGGDDNSSEGYVDAESTCRLEGVKLALVEMGKRPSQ